MDNHDDLFYHFQIDQGDNTANTADSKTSAGSAEIRNLQDQIDHLSLVTQAMCELWEKVGLDKSLLEAKIREIDLREGGGSGKPAKTKNCPQCNRVVAKRHLRCVYCGGNV